MYTAGYFEVCIGRSTSFPHPIFPRISPFPLPFWRSIFPFSSSSLSVSYTFFIPLILKLSYLPLFFDFFPYRLSFLILVISSFPPCTFSLFLLHFFSLASFPPESLNFFLFFLFSYFLSPHLSSLTWTFFLPSSVHSYPRFFFTPYMLFYILLFSSIHFNP